MKSELFNEALELCESINDAVCAVSGDEGNPYVLSIDAADSYTFGIKFLGVLIWHSEDDCREYLVDDDGDETEFQEDLGSLIKREMNNIIIQMNIVRDVINTPVINTQVNHKILVDRSDILERMFGSDKQRVTMLSGKSNIDGSFNSSFPDIQTFTETQMKKTEDLLKNEPIEFGTKEDNQKFIDQINDKLDMDSFNVSTTNSTEVLKYLYDFIEATEHRLKK